MAEVVNYTKLRKEGLCTVLMNPSCINALYMTSGHLPDLETEQLSDNLLTHLAPSIPPRQTFSSLQGAPNNIRDTRTKLLRIAYRT